MSYSFRRNFRMLQRLFPPSGISNQEFPSAVDETVIPSWDIFDVRPGDVQWFLRLHTTVSVGAGTTSIVSVEPPAGFIMLPLRVSVEHTDVANRNVDLFIAEITTSTRDEWGSYFDEFIGAGIAFPIETIVAVPNLTMRASSPFPPVMRATRITANFLALAGAGVTCTLAILGVLIPGEAARLELWNK